MAEHCYAVCHLWSVTYEPFTLSVVILSVIMQSVVTLTVSHSALDHPHSLAVFKSLEQNELA